MPFKTQVFALSRGQFVQVVITEYLMRHWWLYALFLLGIVVLMALGVLPVPLTLLLLPLFFAPLLLSIFSLWRFTRAAANQAFFRRQYCVIDPAFITFHYEDGGLGKMPLANIVRVRRMSNYYLLYTSQTQFVYLPLRVFPSAEAITAFAEALPSTGRG